MDELDRKLRQLGAEVAYPPTPLLDEAVAARLRQEGTARRRGFSRRPRTARVAVLAAVLFLLLAGGVVAAVPAARDAVLDLVGLRGVSVEHVRALPAGVETHLGEVLGKPKTLEAAEDSLGFAPLLPADLGAPNGVFAGGPAGFAPPGGEISLTYAPRPGLPQSKYTGVGLLISEVDGNLAPGTFGKLMPPGARAVRLEIDGHLAIWLAGLHGFFRRLHGFYYRDSEPIFRIGRVRLSSNALLIQRGRVLVRLEGEFELERATQIARSLR